MELNQYQSAAMRTAKFFGDKIEDLNHAALGIGSEAGELAEVVATAWMRLPFNVQDICKEIGDASWYSALVSHTMGWNFEDLILEPGVASDMSQMLASAVLGRNPVALSLCLCAFGGDVLTIVKAAKVYNKPIDEIMLKRKLALVVTTLSLLSDIHGFSYTEVTLETNIEKLRKRFPDAYSDEAALARADVGGTPAVN